MAAARGPVTFTGKIRSRFVFAWLGRAAYRWRWAVLTVWGVGAARWRSPVLPRVPER